MVAFGRHRGAGGRTPSGGRSKVRSLGTSGITPRNGGRKPPPPARRSHPRASLWAKFAPMIPEIRSYARSVLGTTVAGRVEAKVAQVVATAFDFYRLLAEKGHSELAYPEPLTMAALVWLGELRIGEER